jgi:hypothetical protein
MLKMFQFIDMHVRNSAKLHTLVPGTLCFVLHLFIIKISEEYVAGLPYLTILFRL